MSQLNELLRRLLLLPPQASTLAAGIDHLHFTVILLTLLGTGVITALSVLFCWRYRSRRTRGSNESRPPATRPPLAMELGLIGGLFVLFVGFWAWGFWQYVELSTPPDDTYDIYVSAKQWMWKFAYPDGSHSIANLYVPANRNVRLILTSRDVIHSFYVPDFRLKHDAVPGRYTTLWFNAPAPGTHRIMCAEYCGTSHSQMMGQIVALSQHDFQRWRERPGREQDSDLDSDVLTVSRAGSSLSARGEQLARVYGCTRCHSTDGSASVGPSFAGLYLAHVAIQGAGSVIADVAYLSESMMEPGAKLRQGFAAVMPSYVGYLKPGEVGALVEYIKSLQAPASDHAAARESP